MTPPRHSVPQAPPQAVPWERAVAKSEISRSSQAIRTANPESKRQAATDSPGAGRIAVRYAPRLPQRPSQAAPQSSPHGKSLTLRRGLEPQER
jgi:hypothetical protein